MDKKKKVLIVEDEVAIAEDLADILELNNYSVVGIAHTYQKAINLLAARTPDIALLDIALTGEGSGLDVAKLINNKYKIPFVFITSFSDEETVDEVIKVKPSGYIVKPFKEEDINPVVRLAIKKAQLDSAGLPTVEIINTAAKKDLSKQEYNILIHLYKGKSKNQIANDLFVSTNTVKTHVSSLYKKLQVHSNIELIKKIQEIK